MGGAIANKDKLDREDIKFFDGIDGLIVIEELLFFKGTEVIKNDGTVPIKLLEEAAHIHYRLKRSATNKLYVGFYLDRFYRRNGLNKSTTSIHVPKDILEKVKAEEAKYRRPDSKR